MKNRKFIGLMLLSLILLAAINWRGAIIIVMLVLIYDKLFELEDQEMAAIEQERLVAIDRERRQMEKDARFKKFMEEDWR